MQFSIVTISYNQGRFLTDCIKSVIAQRRAGVDLQYIVVDAGSTDGTTAVLERFASEIDVLIQEPDHGPADGLNKGFAHSTGDLLGFINADDFLELGALAAVEDAFSLSPRADVVMGGLRLQEEAREPPRIRIRLPRPFSLLTYLAGSAVVLQQSTFFSRRIWNTVGGFNPHNRTCWDAELLVDIALAGGRFAYLRSILATFRLHERSMTVTGDHIPAYRRDKDRIEAKIVAAGVRQPSFMEAELYRLIMGANPFRRVSEFLASRRYSLETMSS